ncbi:MAG: fasciclin domain-containing protein, partial [Bacteroidota bacterium]
MADEATMPSIVEIALADENFSTLVAALQAGELVETLQGEGPFTVFAPTNAAFEALPEGTLESLLQPENKDQLVGILTYHVVSGKAMAADVVGMSEAATIQGAAVPIAVDGETVNVGEATVVTADVEASNGVIHVIDTV